VPGTASACPDVLRQHRQPWRLDLASRSFIEHRPAAGRWHPLADVQRRLQHCTESACLYVCRPARCASPSSAGCGVVVPDDVFNGCCSACPPALRVIARREGITGHAHKCTLCYDRLGAAWTGMRRRPARRSRSSSARWTSCAIGPVFRVEDLTRPAMIRRGCTGRPRGRGSRRRGVLPAPVDPEVYGQPRTRCHPGPARMWKHVAIARPGWPSRLSHSPGPAAVTSRPAAGVGAGVSRIRARAMVPDADFTLGGAYYGRPVIKDPVWHAPDMSGTFLRRPWPAPPRCWRPAPAVRTATWPGGQTESRSARSTCPPPPLVHYWAGPRASPTCSGLQAQLADSVASGDWPGTARSPGPPPRIRGDSDPARAGPPPPSRGLLVRGIAT